MVSSVICSKQKEYDAAYNSPDLQPRISLIIYERSVIQNINSLILYALAEDVKKEIIEITKKKKTTCRDCRRIVYDRNSSRCLIVYYA
jgi:hypothetical protein